MRQLITATIFAITLSIANASADDKFRAGLRGFQPVKQVVDAQRACGLIPSYETVRWWLGEVKDLEDISGFMASHSDRDEIYRLLCNQWMRTHLRVLDVLEPGQQ